MTRSRHGQYLVPTYVGEFMLGRYCAITDPDETAARLEVVQQVSPYAHLVSGGKATTANLFVNLNTGRRCQVAQYDVVCSGGVKSRLLALGLLLAILDWAWGKVAGRR